MQRLVFKSGKILLLVLLSNSIFTSICIANDKPSPPHGELLFYPRLKANEKKDFYIYLSKEKAPVSKNKSGNIRITEDKEKVLITNTSLQLFVNLKTGRLDRLSIKPDNSSEFMSLGNQEICEPNIHYKAKDGTVLKNPMPQDVLSCATNHGEIAAVVSYRGIYPETGLIWHRHYYIFSRNNYFFIRDIFQAPDSTPKPYSWNIVYSRSQFSIGEKCKNSYLAYNDGEKQVFSGISLPEHFSEKINWIVKPEYKNLGTWTSQYNKEKNLFAGIAFKYHASERKLQVLGSLDKNGTSYQITVLKDIPLKANETTTDDKWIIAGTGDYKEVASLGYVTNEFIPFLFGKLETKTEQAQDWFKGNTDCQYRVKLSLNNYTERDRNNEPFILSLDKLMEQLDMTSIQSIYIVAPKEKNNEHSTDTEISSQIIEIDKN